MGRRGAEKGREGRGGLVNTRWGIEKAGRCEMELDMGDARREMENGRWEMGEGMGM